MCMHLISHSHLLWIGSELIFKDILFYPCQLHLNWTSAGDFQIEFRFDMMGFCAALHCKECWWADEIIRCTQQHITYRWWWCHAASACYNLDIVNSVFQSRPKSFQKDIHSGFSPWYCFTFVPACYWSDFSRLFFLSYFALLFILFDEDFRLNYVHMGCF